MESYFLKNKQFGITTKKMISESETFQTTPTVTLIKIVFALVKNSFSAKNDCHVQHAVKRWLSHGRIRSHAQLDLRSIIASHGVTFSVNRAGDGLSDISIEVIRIWVFETQPGFFP